AFVARIGADRRGQYARDRRDRSVQPEFAEHGEAIQRIRGNSADRRHQAERDRQVVWLPSLGRSAGARLTVIRRAGSARPEAISAERTRSRASETALSARPTT